MLDLGGFTARGGSSGSFGRSRTSTAISVSHIFRPMDASIWDNGDQNTSIASASASLSKLGRLLIRMMRVSTLRTARLVF